MLLRINNFKGRIPKLYAHNLPPNFAQTAENLDLDKGTLRPIAGMESLTSVENVTDPRFIYKLVSDGGDTYWFASPYKANLVLAPVSNSDTRFFYTDGIRPKYSDFDTASNEAARSSGTPEEEYYNGVPKPNTQISTTVSGTAGEDAQADVSYVYTFVNDWGGESRPSTPTAVETIMDDQYVQLTNFESPPPSHYNLVGIRIYRLTSGTGATAEYRLIDGLHDDTDNDCIKFADMSTGTGTVSVTGTTVSGSGTDFVTELSSGDLLKIRDQWFEVDSITDSDTLTVTEDASPDIDAGESFTFGTPWTTQNDKDGINSTLIPSDELAEVLPSEDWYEPYSDLEGLIGLSNGVLAGFTGNSLCASEPYIPYAWPYRNEIITEHDIVAIGNYGTTVVVGTKGYPYVVDLYDPMAMSDRKINLNQRCLFERSMVSGANYVVYITPDGLFTVGERVTDLLTKNLFTKAQWLSLLSSDPTAAETTYDKDVVGFEYDQKYYGFFEGTNTGFILDLNKESGQNFMEFDLSGSEEIYGGFVDPLTDILYLLVKDSGSYYVRSWNDSSSDETYTWKSKVFTFTHYASMSAARVYGDLSGNVTLKVYVDGSLVHTESDISSEDPFRLPAVRGRDWEFELTGTDEVYELMVASSIKELVGNVG